jgi:DNA polymerase elongation subunit (family B)
MGFVLPKKPDYNYEGNEFKQLIAEAQTEGFEGAYRDQFDTGLFFNVGKYDLNSAYPQMISDFCLDPKNLSENEGLKIQLKTRVENKETDVYYFKQNENALLPKVIKSLLVLKNELKEKSKSEDEILKQQYAAVKSICNSAYGVFGNKYFRLFSKPVAETTTFLVRDLLRYIKDNLEQDNYSVLYLDTDSVFVDDKGDDITFILNDLIQTWALKYQKRSYIEFTYEGHFESLLLLKKCHYYGYVKGKTKPEIRGMEVKRSSSSKYEAKFQNELVNKVLKKEKKESIIDWIRTEQERIKTLSFGELGFPAKIASKDYKVETIFSRAVNNSRDLFNLKIGFGELFYYIFVHPIGKDNNGKSRDVIAITENLNLNNKKHLIQINWEETIRRSITSKTENIFEAMKWENPKLQLSDQTSLF